MENETNITSLLKEATQDIVSEENLKQIQEAFDSAVEEKASLHVEKALAEVDEDHTAKVKQLVEAIDVDHTKKMERVVSAINENHAQKLKQVVKKFSTDVKGEAKQLKESVIGNISKYIEVYLEKAVPVQEIQEAAKNKQAAVILENMRKQLAVDSALMNESIKEGIIDAKTQITESKKSETTASDRLAVVEEKLRVAEVGLLLQEKCEDLPLNKKNHIKKIMSDKTAGYITENFQYTLDMFDKTEEERLETLSEKAKSNKKLVDRPVNKRKRTVVQEQSTAINEETKTPFMNDYMSEMSKT